MKKVDLLSAVMFQREESDNLRAFAFKADSLAHTSVEVKRVLGLRIRVNLV